MNLHRLTARAAAFGMAVTMMAGGLVASLATTASADGGTFSNMYQCGDTPFTVSLTPTAALPPSISAGQTAPAGFMNLATTFTVPGAVVPAVKAFGVTSVGISAKDFALSFGSTTIPLPGMKGGPVKLPDDNSDVVMPGNATNGSFTAPAVASAVPVRFPTSFDAVIELVGGPYAGALPATCTIQGAPTTIGAIDIVNQAVVPPVIAPPATAMQDSTIQTRAKKRVPMGEPVVMKVKVKGASTTPTGKVTVSKKGKVIRRAKLVEGKAVVTIKHLRRGSHKLVVKYTGDATTKAAAPVNVRVIRK
jgi:hypothetical protein